MPAAGLLGEHGQSVTGGTGYRIDKGVEDNTWMYPGEFRKNRLKANLTHT